MLRCVCCIKIKISSSRTKWGWNGNRKSEEVRACANEWEWHFFSWHKDQKQREEHYSPMVFYVWCVMTACQQIIIHCCTRHFLEICGCIWWSAEKGTCDLPYITYTIAGSKMSNGTAMPRSFSAEEYSAADCWPASNWWWPKMNEWTKNAADVAICLHTLFCFFCILAAATFQHT